MKVLIGVNEELYVYPTFQINYVYTKESNEGSPENEEFSFQTQEGMECTVDLGVSAHFNPDSISKMFQTYRKGPDEIRNVVIKMKIRDAINKVGGNLPIEYVYGPGKGKLIDTVKLIVKRNLEPTGIIIDDISLISSVRIPLSVKEALDAKVKATQDAMKAENKLRTAEAEAKIRIANAEGEAKSMDIIGDAIRRNPAILDQKAIEKWDGKLPQVTSGSVPFINLK
jgi:regulator of protease activity HflC (stomatin/prohibitin superfamily)